MFDFFLVSLTSVLFVVDPLGALPAYLVMTSGDTAAKRRRTAIRASLTAAAALGLFAFGGNFILHLFGVSLAAFRIAGDLREVAAITVLKMVVHPAIVWLLAVYLFALTPTETAVAVVVAALPSGVNPFILAQRYELYVQRAASSVVITTALSVVTAALLLAWFTG